MHMCKLITHPNKTRDPPKRKIPVKSTKRVLHFVIYKIVVQEHKANYKNDHQTIHNFSIYCITQVNSVSHALRWAVIIFALHLRAVSMQRSPVCNNRCELLYEVLVPLCFICDMIYDSKRIFHED